VNLCRIPNSSWFDKDAHEAARFYAATFPNAHDADRFASRRARRAARVQDIRSAGIVSPVPKI
jgi:predicted 3-demethylubiquinone-9 3-methyltransferase (glyoxalase superfamily)